MTTLPTAPTERTLEVPVAGMDCAECARHVEQAIGAVPGVCSVQVLLASEKAVVRFDPARADLPAIRSAVAGAGYSVPEPSAQVESRTMPDAGRFTRQALVLLGVVFAAVLFVAVVGEWLGFFETVTDRVPWTLGAAAVLAFGFPIFRGVIADARQRRITSHALMSVGALAALAVGEWATAAVVVFFMRVGAYAERFTTERSRRALRDLTAMAPRTARVVRGGVEVEVPIGEVGIGETVVVRPGERIAVDGEVIAGGGD